MEKRAEDPSIYLRRYGLLFGALAGLALCLVGWGVDGLNLAQAGGVLAWGKLGLGIIPCMALCMIAGWTAARVDHGLITTLIWCAIGLIFAWGAAHIPYEGLSWVTRQLRPDLAGFVNYPFTSTQQAQMILAMALSGLFALIAGPFFASFIRGSATSPYVFGRLLPVLLWFVAFSLIGFAVDEVINQPLREPVMVVDRAVSSAIQRQGDSSNSPQSTGTISSPLDPVRDLITRPRQVILMGYDDQIVATDILVVLGDTNVHCLVLNAHLVFCKKINK